LEGRSALNELLLRFPHGFGGTRLVGLVGTIGEHVPRGRGTQLVVLDVLKRGFVRSRPGSFRLGSIE
jgi:hypothetical protein